MDFIQRLQVSAPVNITGIAMVLGLKVWESHALPPDVAGQILRDRENGGSSQYSIIVRAQDPPVRKRFTVAHEIAHYLLHRHIFGNKLQDNSLYRSSLPSPIEAEANALAANLLMPWHLLMPHVNMPISGLARMFEVSEQAMKIRFEGAARYVSALSASNLNCPTTD